jgi:glycosyltransferase involved in cell wall biosynthesis
MRIGFALSGFHRYDRGAEVALLAVADALARGGDKAVVFGSGHERLGCAYEFRHVPALARERFERFPSLPFFRNETALEDASFSAALLTRYRPSDFDVVVTCAFPFAHLSLRAPTIGRRPKQVFVTQNGDWPAFSHDSEYRLFRCDGLVCTNPDYFDRNRERWECALIPNGIDPKRFGGADSDRAQFGLPENRPIVLMVSALIESKRVLDGIRAVAQHPSAHLVVAGDGPLRVEAEELANELLPGRYTRLTLGAAQMPLLYRAVDAFLHLSLLESFGNVFVEALASGLPVVGHDTSRLRWIVGNDEPLCDTEDQAALSATLAKAMAIGRCSAPVDIGRFTWDRIAAEYRSFFERLI